MPPKRLHGALDNDVHAAVRKLLDDDVPANVTSLYLALQRSNSSLKRQRKTIIEASIERVLDFIQPQISDDREKDDTDSDTQIERNMPPSTDDLLNKSLRANLASRPSLETEAVKKRKPEQQSPHKRQKRSHPGLTSVTTEQLSLRDIGGMDDVVEQLEELIVLPLGYPHLYRRLGTTPPKGVLLHGPPGCGKTMIVKAMAAALGKPFVEIQGPAIVSGMSGESEKGIRDRFDEAKKNAPCLLFIDEIDAIAPKRESSGSQMEKRIVAQLLVSMDDLNSDPDETVVVVAATNRPDSIDPALRRGGRFGSEISIKVPNEHARSAILRTQARKMSTSDDIDFVELAKRTAGFVGADLRELVDKACMRRANAYREAVKQQAIQYNLCGNDATTTPAISSMERLIARANRQDLPEPAGFEVITVGMGDFLAVIPNITPSSKREGFATVPDVSWKDVGAMKSVRQELQDLVVHPIQNPEKYKSWNIPPAGVLLWGPPGCGKTLLAKAVAAESQANFISVKGPELLNKFFGESEAAVRKVFSRARSSVPCVIFFDELDALVPRRNDSGSEASSRVVNTLLTELDGIENREGIHVIAATNRPDMIDEAMLRPGRLGTSIFIDLPGAEERVDIMKALARTRCVITPAIEEVIIRQCHDFSGADLGSLLNGAMQNAIKRQGNSIELEDFEITVKNVESSVKDAERYRRLKVKLGKQGN